jgi:excisionase family DNA binding protein
VTDRMNEQQRQSAAPRLLTLKDAAEELGLAVWTLRRAIWEGELPQIKIGRSIRIDRNDLENWLARCKVRGPNV